MTDRYSFNPSERFLGCSFWICFDFFVGKDLFNFVVNIFNVNSLDIFVVVVEIFWYFFSIFFSSDLVCSLCPFVCKNVIHLFVS